MSKILRLFSIVFIIPMFGCASFVYQEPTDGDVARMRIIIEDYDPSYWYAISASVGKGRCIPKKRIGQGYTTSYIQTRFRDMLETGRQGVFTDEILIPAGGVVDINLGALHGAENRYGSCGVNFHFYPKADSEYEVIFNAPKERCFVKAYELIETNATIVSEPISLDVFDFENCS